MNLDYLKIIWRYVFLLSPVSVFAGTVVGDQKFALAEQKI